MISKSGSESSSESYFESKTESHSRRVFSAKLEMRESKDKILRTKYKQTLVESINLSVLCRSGRICKSCGPRKGAGGDNLKLSTSLLRKCMQTPIETKAVQKCWNVEKMTRAERPSINSTPRSGMAAAPLSGP